MGRSSARARTSEKERGARRAVPLPVVAGDRGRAEARPYKCGGKGEGKSGRKALQDGFGPVFEGVFYFVEKLVGDGAVDDAVVVAQGDIAHRADGDGVVDDDRALFDGAEAEDA